MASNAIPNGINDLLRLSNEAQAGAAALGASIPVLINTSGELGSSRGNLFQLEGVYQVTLGQLPAARKPLFAARAAGTAFARTTRKWLEHTYGSTFNQDWRAVGFIHGSLRIPTDDTELAALLERMGLHLSQNPGLENTAPKVNVTAVRANGFAAALTAGLNGVNAKKQESVTNKTARDGAKTALRRRLSGLVGELGQRLADDDGRWRRFGLNLPAAPTVPTVPRQVTVKTNTPGELFILCAASKHATHYRFFTRRPGIDPEPVHVGNSDAPLFHLSGLPPGLTLEVLVTAANAGAESRFGPPVTAVVRAADAAAA